MHWLIFFIMLFGAGFVNVISWSILDAITIPWFTYSLALTLIVSVYWQAISWKPKGDNGNGKRTSN